MNRCDDVLEAWASHLAGGEPLDVASREHLASCPRCSQEKEELAGLWRGLDRLADEAPTDELRGRLAATLLAYRETLDATASAGGAAATADASSAPGQPLPFKPRSRRRAAVRLSRLGWLAATLLAGIGIGVLARPLAGPREEVVELRREVGDLREVLALSLLQQSSASARLEGVSVGATVAGRNPEVLAALFTALEGDPSPNVRLAAVDALASRAQEPAVRGKLGEALHKEGSPLVQIALVDALLSAHDARARKLVEPLADDADVRPEVREFVRQQLGRDT
jgi:hypothetical protein